MADSRSGEGWASIRGDSRHDYSDLTFMIVDDEPFILELVDDVLRRCKAKDVERFSNGKDALDALKLEPQRFDLIVSDCNMQPINGLQLLRAVREGKVAPEIKDMPIIFLSGHNDAPVVKRAIELGVSGFLTKPVSLDKLTTTISTAMEKARAFGD